MNGYRAHHRLSVTIVRYVWFTLGARRPARAILGAWGGRRLSGPRQAGRPVRQLPAPPPARLRVVGRRGGKSYAQQLDVAAALAAGEHVHRIESGKLTCVNGTCPPESLLPPLAGRPRS